ncbi:retrovirus-related pol polyprotein from transposon TNT 1-94 [Tanacetum coccineum]
MALISLSFNKIYKPTNNNLRTPSNTSRANQDNSPRINRGTGYDNHRVINVAGARENVGTQVVQKSRIQCYNYKEYGHVQLNAEQADWKDDTDDKSDDQELEAHYMYMAQIQEVTPDAVDNSGPIFDIEPLHKVQDNNDNYNVFAMENEHPDQPRMFHSLDTYAISTPQLMLVLMHVKCGMPLKETYDQEPDMVTEDDALSKEKEIDKLMALISLSFKKIYKPTKNNLRTSSNTSRANQNNSLRINREQTDWRDDTDDEPDDQELKAHYMYMAQIQEVTPDATDNFGTIFDIEPLHKVHNDNDTYNVFANDTEHPEQPESVNDAYLEEQGDDDDLARERDLLASLIEKLKCEIDDNKNRNKFLESSNKALVEKLKGEIEDFKTKNKCLESSNNHFKEANNELSKTNHLMFKDLKKFQAELDRYHDVNYALKVAHDCANAKGDLMSYKMEFEKSFNKYTRKINDLNQTISEMKKELFAHQKTISIKSQEKEAQKKFHKTREYKELEKVIALENKIKVLDDIVYKTGQSTQTMNMLNRNCKTSFVKPEFLKKAQRANPRLYDISCYNDNLALMLAPKSDETIRLAQESRSRLRDLMRPFDNKNLNNLYDLFVPQREKSPEHRYFSEREYYYADHTNAILGAYTTLDEFIDLQCDYVDQVVKCKRLEKELSKTNIMSKSFEALQQHAIDLELALQQYFSKSKSVTIINVSNDFSKPVAAQILPQNFPQDIRKTNKRVTFSIEVISTTSVSRPHLKNNQLEDRVMHNNSEGKKQQVEDHRRNFRISNNKMFVTACNDSLNAKTSNTKMAMVVPISTREPKRIMNQYAAIPLKRTIAAESTNQKPRSIIGKQYEQISTLKFGNDQIAPILGYGDLVQGNITIKRVYYVEGLNHNLFSVGQFCDADLEVAFWKSTCYICDLKGNDLLTGSRGTDLYSITLQDTSTPNLICLMAKSTSSQAWLWHRHLSHFNFNTVNLLSKYDIVTGLPKLKFVKDHLCSFCELGKAKRKTHFLRSKDETPEVLIDFLKLVQRGLHAQGARTMLSAAKVPLFFWAKEIATTCFTQNRSLVIPRHEKTPYHIINGQKPSVKFFHIFGSLCYIVKDGENLNKVKEKGDACIFVGYSTQSRAYRVYNKRPRVIVETIHVNFDKLSQMVLDHVSSDPVPQSKTVTMSNELDLLFSPMFDELLNGTTPDVSKYSAVTIADAPNQRQHKNITSSTSTTVAADIPPLNIQTTPETTSPTPTQAPTINANENIIQA